MRDDFGTLARIEQRKKFADYRYVAPHDRLPRPMGMVEPAVESVVEASALAIAPLPEPIAKPVPPPHPPIAQRPATIVNVQRTFCEAYSELSGEPYTMADLVCSRRYRDLAWPRAVCIRLVRLLCLTHSTPTIGRAFGKRDHTTVLHALKRARDHVENIPVLKATHDRVLAAFETQDGTAEHAVSVGPQ